MPREIVDRNLKRATDGKAADFAEVVYECYGAGASGFVIEALTDNVNRSAADVRGAPLPSLGWGGKTLQGRGWGRSISCVVRYDAPLRERETNDSGSLDMGR